MCSVGSEVDVRGRRQANQRDHEKDASQRQRKRAEIRSGAIDEKPENIRGYGRQHEIEDRYDNPKHRTLQAVRD
jgi:hypothetical protein